MKNMSKKVTLLLAVTLGLTPVLKALVLELLQETETGRVIVLSEKVGETIDLAERNYYRLPLVSSNFLSAVILQFADSSLAVQITELKDGAVQKRNIPISRTDLENMRRNIRKESPFFLNKDVKVMAGAANKEAKEKWTKERWQDQTSYDQGSSYRATGGVLGFTLGAAVGMLIGKGFQGQKVKRQVQHEAGWGADPWTENFYSYENEYAPYWGAGIGGVGGAVAGYFLGKNADQEYYILVPKNIRTERTEISEVGSLLGGGGIGFVMGGIAGRTLYAPMSHNADKMHLGGNEFLSGFIVGTSMGIMIINGYKGRSKHKQLWEDSILWKKPESSLGIQFIPLDPAAFSIHPQKLPSGEIFYEYRMNMLKVRF
jgi:hypothetical protein